VRILVVLLSLFIGTAAQASDEAEAALARALAASNDGRPYDAIIHSNEAIRGGLPDALLPLAEALYCSNRAWVRLDREVLDYCKSVLRHGGVDGRENAEVLGSMMADLAMFSTLAGRYKDAETIVDDFNRRYKEMTFPYLLVERQKIDIAHAEALRASGQSAAAMEMIEKIVRDGLHRQKGEPRAQNELRGLEAMKVLLFAAADMRDQDKIRNSLERFDKTAIQLRTSEGSEYASAIMLCAADILVSKVGLESRKIYGEVLNRTRISMGLLAKAYDLNRQRPLLRSYVYLLKECGPRPFYAIMPGTTISELRQKNAGEGDFQSIFDHYRAGRYAEMAQILDRIVLAMRDHPGTAATVSADHLSILRKYLLETPGRKAPG